MGSIDLVVVEGFKHETFPKIELHRRELNGPFLHVNDDSIVAIASDDDLSVTIPVLDINNPEQIANFIIHRFLNINHD